MTVRTALAGSGVGSTENLGFADKGRNAFTAVGVELVLWWRESAVGPIT